MGLFLNQRDYVSMPNKENGPEFFWKKNSYFIPVILIPLRIIHVYGQQSKFGRNYVIADIAHNSQGTSEVPIS